MTIHIGWLFLIVVAVGAWWYFKMRPVDHQQ
jgi:hypothetical protein